MSAVCTETDKADSVHHISSCSAASDRDEEITSSEQNAKRPFVDKSEGSKLFDVYGKTKNSPESTNNDSALNQPQDVKNRNFQTHFKEKDFNKEDTISCCGATPVNGFQFPVSTAGAQKRR